MDLRLRYKMRLAEQERLAGKYQWEFFARHIASGHLSIVTVELGAKLIVDGSHAEATPEEVAAHQERDRREGERLSAHTRMMSRINFRPGGEEVDPNARVYKFR